MSYPIAHANVNVNAYTSSSSHRALTISWCVSHQKALPRYISAFRQRGKPTSFPPVAQDTYLSRLKIFASIEFGRFCGHSFMNKFTETN